jgi:hypothetical protein
MRCVTRGQKLKEAGVHAFRPPRLYLHARLRLVAAFDENSFRAARGIHEKHSRRVQPYIFEAVADSPAYEYEISGPSPAHRYFR